ncbi:MAG TPA: MarR family transcriptional regulator [Candidatus Acidoferrum sp.]|nr:MarR family transcriptional regulator [Candidatus Acidoferrum sp.]
MARLITQKQKTLRAFSVYVELLDTAAWLRYWMRGPLALFDLTTPGFRLLELLYRQGPLSMPVASKKLRYTRQNLELIFRRLNRRGWVRREPRRRPPVEMEPKRLARLAPGTQRRGRQVRVLELTEQGEKFIGYVFPRHAKVVKALMRALEGREQNTLKRLCQKLREGHILKFTSELTHPDRDEVFGDEGGG